ncbi:uncharacterized protein LOC135480687 isoform X1 [Liolophura sinensis]|uniref:uncharacterized protein LOC135480687 isoform X1 n=1 Tax=Liolophura sinensis TaxID=3198878 RepID=UPI0031591119
MRLDTGIVYVTIPVVFVITICCLSSVQSQYDAYSEDALDSLTNDLPTNSQEISKRYARLSYSPPSRWSDRSRYSVGDSYYRYARLSHSRGRGRWGSRSRGRSGINDMYKRYKAPWLFLPNNSRCYRQPCRSHLNCCRRYNLCDPNIKRCIDCWYGKSCRTSSDCCERFPFCNSALGRCQN